MQYTKAYESKIIRVIHKITLFQTGTVDSLRKVLSRIPDHARLTSEEEDESGRTMLVFEEEKEIS